jgi:hypothetical protein
MFGLFAGRGTSRGTLLIALDSQINFIFGVAEGQAQSLKSGLALSNITRAEIEEGLDQSRNDGFLVGRALVNARSSVRYTMRAFFTSINGYVYWDVVDIPDTTGSLIPSPPSGTPLDIVIVSRIDLS